MIDQYYRELDILTAVDENSSEFIDLYNTILDKYNKMYDDAKKLVETNKYADLPSDNPYIEKEYHTLTIDIENSGSHSLDGLIKSLQKLKKELGNRKGINVDIAPNDEYDEYGVHNITFQPTTYNLKLKDKSIIECYALLEAKTTIKENLKQRYFTDMFIRVLSNAINKTPYNEFCFSVKKLEYVDGVVICYNNVTIARIVDEYIHLSSDLLSGYIDWYFIANILSVFGLVFTFNKNDLCHYYNGNNIRYGVKIPLNVFGVEK